jgi:hypothetical protein
MIRTFALAAALACAAAPATAQQPIETCGVLQITDAERVSYIPIPGYSILGGTPPFAAPPGSVHAVVCDRTSIFLGANDHRVISDLRVPLFIRNAGRVAILEAADGQLRVRFTQGQPSPVEAQALAASLDRANAEMASLLRQTPQP